MVKRAAQITATLIAARLLYWPTKALIAWAYNRMTPDVSTDLRQVEYDGFVTLYHSPPIH